MRIINIFDEINEETTKEILHKIIEYTIENKNMTKEEIKNSPITVNIYSPGGDVYGGFAIVDALKDSGSEIITKAYGRVESMGLTIFLAGDKRLAGKNTKFLYHSCLGGIEGNSPKVQQYLDELKDINKQIKSYMFERGCTISEDTLDKFLESGDDYIFYYDEAKKYNFITE